MKTSQQSASLTANTHAKKAYVLACVIASGSLLTGLLATSTTAQAAGLGDLFGSSQNTAQSKFLPVDEAFQVSSSSASTKSGTRLSIAFDITPEHYVYKNQIKLTLPAGVTAAPLPLTKSHIQSTIRHLVRYWCLIKPIWSQLPH
nr:protein-disulfide reductase DsbD domain-containing protein [Psychrobacter sp. KH172YL61]